MSAVLKDITLYKIIIITVFCWVNTFIYVIHITIILQREGKGNKLFRSTPTSLYN